ncbi:MAG: DUF2868 domain-containing protein [Verrucomicrobia bacterium]|nr:DUF2868 domain-containing protein [Verrucomicrobiota bacterium]
MARETQRWTLADLIDFEQGVVKFGGATGAATGDVRMAVAEAVRGLQGAAARRVGLRVWLNDVRSRAGGDDASAGRKFANALALVAGGLGLLMWLAGLSCVLGLLDRERGGLNVTLCLAVLLGGQWLVILAAAFGWLLRRRLGDGGSGLQALLGRLVRRLVGSRDEGWWRELMVGGGAARAALLWRLARLVQGAGVCFNLGIICGLAGLVLVKHVGFFWETTTTDAMRTGLQNAVHLLALPWSAWWPEAVPNAAVIDASRWLPGRAAGLAPGPSEWWTFLLMAVLGWGLLPRAILWLLAWRLGGLALTKLEFQGRAQRALWRELTGIERAEADEKPLDGVLVLDVGGSGLTREMLRPFLLRRLRVHPAAWQAVAVLDSGAEAQAAQALALAPAGVVLLAEGWALSPARMTALHGQIRRLTDPATPVKFLVVNVDVAGHPVPPTAEEQREWVRYVDALRDPAAEVFRFEHLPPDEC